MTTGPRSADHHAFDPATEAHQALRYQAKAALRKKLLALRNAIPETRRKQRSAAAMEHVAALDAWKSARCIAGYVAMRGELDPQSGFARAALGNCRVVFPRITAGSAAGEPDAMDFADPVDGFEPSPLGFMQPSAHAPRVAPQDIDLVLVPLAAVDVRGYRIGYGGGYYDRFLPTATQATSVGVAYDFQVMAELPNTEGDVCLDVVVSDAGIVKPNTA